jgi:hypothetical protein
MPEDEVEHGGIWLHADERVVQTIPLDQDHLGLITTRSTRRFYASVLRLDRSRRPTEPEAPQWEPVGVDRVACASAAEARRVIGSFRMRTRS